MKLSHGLKLLLAPLSNLFKEQYDYPTPESSFKGLASLSNAIRKVGKRGEYGTYYPTDLKRVNLILDTTSELTGKRFEVTVHNGDIRRALDVLSLMLKYESFFQTMEALANP